MSGPVVHIETLKPVSLYTDQQIQRAFLVATILDRGKLVLVEPPNPQG